MKSSFTNTLLVKFILLMQYSFEWTQKGLKFIDENILKLVSNHIEMPESHSFRCFERRMFFYRLKYAPSIRFIYPLLVKLIGQYLTEEIYLSNSPRVLYILAMIYEQKNYLSSSSSMSLEVLLSIRELAMLYDRPIYFFINSLSLSSYLCLLG